MKTHYKAAATLAFLCLNLFANASHIVGGYLRYECINGLNYRFILTMYRDCDSGGAPFDSDFNNGAPFAANVTLYQGSSSSPFQVIDLAQPTVDTVSSPDNCFSLLTQCVERGTYHFEVEFPSNDLPIHVVYQRCCRPPEVSNILAPGESGMTFSITLTPEALGVCNSSPMFIDPPMMCSQYANPFVFDHSAVDGNGDSVAYEFCAPLLGGGNDQTNPESPGGVSPNPDMPPPYANIGFIEPVYSATEPIPGTPNFSIDASMGEVTAVPNMLGLFAYAVCAREFRNGQLLSETRFEFLHTVSFFTDADERTNTGRLTVYPNPATQAFTVELPAANLLFDVMLYDVNGRLMEARHGVSGPSVVFSTTDFMPGVYLVQLRNGQETYFERMVVY